MSVAIKSLPEILDQLRHDLVLNDEELAAILGIPPAVLEHSRVNLQPLSVTAARRLDQLLALDERLQDTFKPDFIPVYLRSGSRYLGGVTPLAALTDGHFDWVTTALDALDAGVFI